ncbi:hypothetical protein HF086_002633 [Spodoptera exigua]|uniref:Ig-like domain-containing protein n=1 Tax=Spodoptera exigua TaxID=7107 RepID=A0A922M8S2_SPOEX|nr:hypothetical protein HF086_002633 [Spodoptera exigua]
MKPFMLIFVLLTACLAWPINGQETDIVVLRAIRGREARLPCGQGTVFLDGPSSYVLWLKDDRDFLYRFPNEEYEHRCRVHYQTSPSVDHLIELRVIGIPTVYNDDEEVKGVTVGPLSVGSDLTLSCRVQSNENYGFEAGIPRLVDCVVIGCVPAPSISWHLGDTLLRPTSHKEVNEGNYTVSTLTLSPSLQESHYELTCRAHNSHMPSELFQDKVVINVGYRPTCQTGRVERVGAVLREAETVHCIVDASPEPLQFTWTFEDSKTLYTSGTRISSYRNRYSSSLTWLSRDGDIGLLQCRATNAFGEQKNPCVFNITAGGPPESPE